MSATRREVVAAFIPHSPLVQRLGIEVRSLDPDVAELVLPFDPANATMGDVVHGGAIASLIDTAGMAAAWCDDTPAPEVPAGATVSLSIDYVAAARSTGLVARADVVRRGGRMCFCEIAVRDDAGEVVAKGLLTHRFG